MARRSRTIGGFVLPSGIFTTTLIRSIQRGTITIADPATSNTATITAVNTSRAYVRWLGFNCTAPVSSQAEANAHLVLTNATTVTATRNSGGSPSNTVVVSYEVIEFMPGVIKRIQVGTATIADTATSGTATVSSVNTNKTQLESNGWIDADAAGLKQNMFADIRLTNATTITATRQGTTGALTVAFTLLEYQ